MISVITSITPDNQVVQVIYELNNESQKKDEICFEIELIDISAMDINTFLTSTITN